MKKYLGLIAILACLTSFAGAIDIENWSSTRNGTAKITSNGSGTATLTIDAAAIANITFTGDITALSDIKGNGINLDMGEANTNVFAITASQGVTTSAGLTVGTDLTVTGGDITGKSGTSIEMGEAAAGTLTLAGTNVTLSGVVSLSGAASCTSTFGVGTDLTVSGGDVTGKSGTSIEMGEAAAGTLTLAGTNVTLSGIVSLSGAASCTSTFGVGTDLTVSGGDIAGKSGTSIEMGEAVAGTLTLAGTNVSLSGTASSTAGFTVGTDLTVSGGDITGKSGTSIEMGEAVAGTLTLSGTNVSLSGAVSCSADLTVTGGDINGATSTAIDMGEASSGVVAITAANGTTTSAGLTASGALRGTYLVGDVMASANVTSNTFLVAAITKKYVILKSLGEAFDITLPNPSVAGQELVLVADATQNATNFFHVVDSGNVECGSDITNGANDTVSLFAVSATQWVCVGNKNND